MLRKLISMTIVLFFAIGCFKYADAHVTLNPNQSEPGSYDKYDVRFQLSKIITLSKLN